MGTELKHYTKIIEQIFLAKYKEGKKIASFEVGDIEKAATNLGIKPPNNICDFLYSFRHHTAFPHSITNTAPFGERWVIERGEKGRYQFRLRPEDQTEIVPNPIMSETKIPDVTPGIVAMYTLHIANRARYGCL